MPNVVSNVLIIANASKQQQENQQKVVCNAYVSDKIRTIPISNLSRQNMN